MTLIISPKGVKNTKSTTAKFGGGGQVHIGGDFENSGRVEIDVKANLNIAGTVINSGSFGIKDYVTEAKYDLIDDALQDLQGESKEYLMKSYKHLKRGNDVKATNYFRKFYSYIKDHPELVVGSVQVLLQVFVGR